jgi:hypothetical protein
MYVWCVYCTWHHVQVLRIKISCERYATQMAAAAPLEFPKATGLCIKKRVDLNVLRAQIACPKKVLELDNSESKHHLDFLSKYANAVDDTGA